MGNCLPRSQCSRLDCSTVHQTSSAVPLGQLVQRELGHYSNRNDRNANEIGLDWIKYFDKHIACRTKGIYRLLILDGHKTHYSTVFELYYKEHIIRILCMPPNSSYFLQPLEIGCFGPMKKAYGRQIEDQMRVLITRVSRIGFLCAFSKAFFASMPKKHIQRDFVSAGIVPYNPERVLPKLDVQLRTTTPTGSVRPTVESAAVI